MTLLDTLEIAVISNRLDGIYVPDDWWCEDDTEGEQAAEMAWLRAAESWDASA